MELLAPAGNFQCLKAAVINGADAVYLGMEKFGARAQACNFNADNLASAVEFAHLHGVKIYLTVNTLIKDGEMNEAVEQTLYANGIGVDAFIVQDLGFIGEIKKRAPNIVLHASTQMGISNAYGAEFAKKAGLTRIVAARETLLEDVLAIKEKTGLEVEFFCHGALCVAYSGNCYYSSLVSGCSGNRGRCLQLCRKKYNRGSDSGYFLSAKDVCLADKISALRDAGVDSLKIEGRMRTPEYVAETVAVYRRAIDGKYNNIDELRLKKVFNRGDYCNAYVADPTENVIYPKVQNNIGVHAGTVKYVKSGKAKLSLETALDIGDGVKYLRNGYEVGGGLIDGDPTGYRGNVKSGDEVRLTSSAALSSAVANAGARIPVDASVVVNVQNGAEITLSCERSSVTVAGKEGVVKAQNKPICAADIKKSVGTLGETDFVLRNINVNVEENIFYPVSLIKEMRKRATDELRKSLLCEYTRNKRKQTEVAEMPRVQWLETNGSAVFVRVKNIETLSKLEFNYDFVILAPDDYNDVEKIKADCLTLGSKALLDLPVIVRGGDIGVLLKLKELPWRAVVANNISHFEMFNGVPFVGGIGLNHMNSFYCGTFIDSVERDTLGKGIAYAFGKPPLMHFAHCPRKNSGKSCKDCNGYEIRMQDDKGVNVKFSRVKEKYCYGLLIPELPINNISYTKGRSKLLDIAYASDDEITALNRQMLTGCENTLECTHGNYNRKLQ